MRGKWTKPESEAHKLRWAKALFSQEKTQQHDGVRPNKWKRPYDMNFATLRQYFYGSKTSFNFVFPIDTSDYLPGTISNRMKKQLIENAKRIGLIP